MTLLFGTLYAWILNTLYAAGAMLLIVAFLAICQRWLGGRIEIKKELFKGNIAVAIVVASVVLGICFIAGTAYGRQANGEYDHSFRKYAHRYFARGIDWRWFKAQGIAESGLNPRAVSPAGAKGIMQIMPATWDELMPPDTRIWQFSATMSIAAGIAYDRKLWSLFALANPTERRRVMFAAYNCGPGNLRRARSANRKEGWSDNWNAISCHLSAITGYRAWETINYIRRIERLYSACQGGS